MGQAEIQKALSDGKWKTISEICNLINHHNRPPISRALNKMLKYNEIERKSFRIEWRIIPLDKQELRLVPHYRIVK